MNRLLTILLASAILPVAACNLYFADESDPEPDMWCDDMGDWGGGGSLGEPAQTLRNPDSGQCETFGYDGTDPIPCGPCEPCPGADGDTSNDGTTTPSDAPAAEQAPLPSWGLCESSCTGLDELICLASADCRGIYDEQNQFRECWQTDQGPGGILIDDCLGLDPYGCSQFDQCAAVHRYDCDPDADGFVPVECEAGPFVACQDEPLETVGCYGENECGDGTHCNAAEVCLPPPGGGDCNGENCDVPAVCFVYCVPDDITVGSCDLQNESMCIVRDDCSPYYIGVGCTCDPNGCDCTSWTYDSCNSN